MTDTRIAVFQAERRRLAGLAYRMTGSVADTEDILQLAWIRFMRQDPAAIRDRGRWLGAVVTRLCLDHLKTARVRREAYVGAWLPDPIVEAAYPGPEEQLIIDEDVGIALLLTLDRLTPEMRAAFLLRDAFDYDFDEIAGVVGTSAANARQLVSRARRRLAGADPGDMAPPEESLPIARAFWQASRRGEMQALLDLFAADIEVHTDGGGKVVAAINVLKGSWRAASFFVGLARKRPPSDPPCPPLCRINGSVGFVSRGSDGVLQSTALGIRGGRIAAIWITRNPDKLRHLSTAALTCQ